MLRIEFIALCGLFVFMVTPPVEGKGCEDLTIRVSGIPEKLSFPIPEGTNYILTATIKGGKVRSVWLANRHDAKGRVMLKRVDEAEYQINLAEPAVFGLMRTYSSRSFKVFAETEEGKIHESISLQYSILRASPASMKVFILSRSEKEEVRRTYPWNRRFLTPKSIDGVMIEYGRESPSPFACAYVGKKKWTLEYGVSKNALHLNLTSEIRSCWSAKGLLTLQYGADKEHSKEIELYAIPLKLDLPGNVGKVTVHQRSKVSLPGCNDYLKVKLGDITAGQTLLTLSTGEGKKLIDRQSVKQGDRFTFALSDEKYTLSIKKLVNLLVGNDFALLEVSKPPPSEIKRIDRLIELIAASDFIFIRNEKEYTAAEAAKHLRDKYELRGPDVHSVQDFIEKIASRSSLSGKPYLIRFPDGKTIKTGVWLDEKAAKLVKEGEKTVKPTER